MINPMALQQIMANQQNMNSLQQQFSQFSQQFQGAQNFNPQEMVQQKLASGEMTQQQFEQLRAMANQLMGVRY